MLEFFRRKPINLFHPESPGIRVTVKRSHLGRLLKDRHFATLGEVLVK